jgi:hypothetical protein
MSKQERKQQERQEREAASAATAAASLRAALSENREIERLGRQVDAEHVALDAARDERHAAEDAAIAAEAEAENAQQAEYARRLLEEPVGSTEWAARRAKDRGLAAISSADLVAMPTRERERLRSEHPDLWYATVAAHGDAEMARLMSA